MQNGCRGHCHSSALKFATVCLVLIVRLFQHGPDVLGSEDVLETVVDDFGDNFDDGAVFREMTDSIQVYVNAFFLGLLPKLSCCVLLCVVRNELSCVLTICLGVEY